jgi:hypothetical protein
MRPTKRASLTSLLASLAFLLIAVAAAEAAKPEFTSFGVCREMKGFAGFPTKNWRWTKGPAPCEGESGGTGTFAESAFVLAKEGTVAATLTAKGGFTIKCTGDTGQGEITGAKKDQRAYVRFTNCVDSFGGKCTTNGLISGEVQSFYLEGEIGYIPTTTRVGIDLWPESRTLVERANHEFNATLMEFSCPVAAVKAKIRGGVIGEITPLNKAIKGVEGHFTLEYTQKEGVQTLTKLEGVEGGAENQLQISLNGAAYEKLGFSLKEELIPVELEEIKA